MSQFIRVQDGHPSSRNHLAFMKNYSPGFIVSAPVKCNQANQAVKKCNETRFVDLFRVQIYEGDKSFRHKKGRKIPTLQQGRELQWTHFWLIRK